MAMQTRIKQRFDYLSNWIQNDIVLLQGELAVVDCESQIRFKIGDGVKSFTQLSFVDQNQLCTNWLVANAISQGLHASSIPYGFAAGAYLCANANFSQTLGFDAQTPSSDTYSFVWNGDDTRAIGDYYQSHGKGTFSINALSGLSGIFIGEQSLAELFDSKGGNKITIDDRISGICQQSDLSVIKLCADDYYQLVSSGNALSNCLYVVQNQFSNMYGQQLKNVAIPTDLSDAANKEYVDSAISSNLNNFYRKSETSSAVEISDAFSSIDTGNKIFIDDKISSVSGYSDLSVVKLGAQEYSALLTGDSLLSNALYIVEDDHIDAYGQQIKNIAYPTDLSDAATKEYVDSSLSNVEIPEDLSAFSNSPGFLTKTSADNIFQPIGSYLLSDDVKLSYSNQTIWLSSKAYVTSVDCADFIKDGMLSTAELCGTTLVLNFNTDAGSDPISVELSNFVDNYDSKIDALSDAIDKKVFVSDSISGISGYSDLSVVKLSADEYAALLTSNQLLSNALYIVEDNYIDAYGQQIKNVASPTDLSDITNKEYVDNAISSSLNDYYRKSETSSTVEISAAFASIDTGNKIFIDDQISSVSGYSDLSVIKLNASEYSNLLTSNSLLSNALYIVQDNYMDAYGQQLKNLSAPSEISDAATKGYVDDALSNIQIPTDLSAFTNSPGYLVSNDISDYYKKSETSSSSEIRNAFELSSGNKVFIDDRISGIVEQTDLSIVHLSSSEYEQLCADGQILSNALYIVEDSFTNNYGKQIKNVAIPSLSNDAATKGYVDDSISNRLSDFYHKSETSSANEISVALSAKAELSDINAMKSFVENTYKTYDYISAQLSNNGYMTSAQIAEQQYVTFTDVSTMISSTIGNINSILEEINVGNMQIGSMIDQLNGIEA